MLLLLLLWAALGGTLYTIATTHPPMEAFTRWLILLAVLCVVGGLAIRSQPLGEATIFGRLGSVVVRWGFAASQGKLWAAGLISWLVWLVIGAGAIGALHFRHDLQPVILSLGWATEVLLLFYLIGMWMANAGADSAFRMKFVSMAGMVVLLLATSMFLWFQTTGAPRTTAVLIAAIPLGITLLYGIFLAVMVLVGGKTRWN
jgi:hypothetical protein